MFGGRALKKTFTRRYTKREFTKVRSELNRVIRRTFARCEVPRFYHTKETFGDIDILVSIDGNESRDIKQYIIDTFSPNEIFHNGNCWSFDFKEIQVDLMFVAEEHFDSNFNYLSFNDLGNFIGRLAHGFGLRYGQEGLWVTYYYKDTKHKIMISKDYPKIYEFLGLDYKRWLNGFETLEEIFEFISESPYFNWQKFQPSELNRINRERNLKRASYMTFLEWMDTNVADEDHEYQFSKDKTPYYAKINEFFPEANLLSEISRIEYEVSRVKYAKSIFNGKVVMDVFDIHGAALGKAMDGFNKHMRETMKAYYKQYVDEVGADEVYLDYCIRNGRNRLIDDFDMYIQGVEVESETA